MKRREQYKITGTSPASASTAAVGSVVRGLSDLDWIEVAAVLVGATGGTLDVYLQRELETDVWVDWAHFAQLSAGASAVNYVCSSQAASSISTVGKGTLASPAVALPNATFTGGHPGDALRVVAVAGSGTSAGAAITVYVIGYRNVA